MKIAPSSGLGVWVTLGLMLACSGGWSQEVSPSQLTTNRTARAESDRVRQARLNAQRIPGMLPARLSATVYEVQVATNQAVALDAGALSGQAGTAETLLKALATAGKTRILYRLDQPVNVFSENITIGASEPVITGTQITADGQAVNDTSYVSSGLIIRLTAQSSSNEMDHGLPGVTMSARLSTLPQGGLERETGQVARPVLLALLEHSEPFEFDRPMVMLGVSEIMPGNQPTAIPKSFPTVRYVVRYVFSKPVATSAALAKEASSNSEPQSSVSNFPAQFQSTICEVKVAADHAGSLDAAALTRQAGTAETLLKALSESGEARILYRVDEAVNVYSDQIQIGANERSLAGVSIGSNGHAVNAMSAHRTGVNVRLAAQPATGDANPHAPDVNLTLSVSTLVPSEVDFAPGRNATATRTMAVTHSEPLAFGRPQLMLAVRSASATEQTTATVYVIRYLFSPPAGKQ